MKKRKRANSSDWSSSTVRVASRADTTNTAHRSYQNQSLLNRPYNLANSKSNLATGSFDRPGSSLAPERLTCMCRRRKTSEPRSIAGHQLGLIDPEKQQRQRMLAPTSPPNAYPLNHPTAFPPTRCRKAIRQHVACLLLCALLSLDIVVCSIVIPRKVNEASELRNDKLSGIHENSTTRTKRQSNLVGLDELNSEILVQTKQGFFKGVLLSSNGSPLASAKTTKPKSSDRSKVIDADVVGFLGIRYASAPIKRLRFMPPTAYRYAPNQVHDMNKFGPICRQRLPLDFGLIGQSAIGRAGARSGYHNETGTAEEVEQQQQRFQQANQLQGASGNSNSRYSQASHETSRSKEAVNEHNYSGNGSSWLSMQMRLMRDMVPKESYAQLRPLIKRLLTLEQSEDCLNLNVYTPLEAIVPPHSSTLDRASSRSQAGGERRVPIESSLLPVLVIVHGESFDFGAGSTINGFKFVQQTRLLAVTLNYRLNILGFPPKLAGASRGNLGLMDQVAALHWIKDNIGSFGGSPSNITLMGTKRGAIFVNLLMLSPLAKGLFHRAVLEDGSALTPLVANHIASPAAGLAAYAASGAHSSSPLLQPSIEHLRLLAKLCDCPIHRHQVHQRTRSNSSSLAAADVAANSGNGPALLSGSQQQQQQQQTLANDEAKMNALTFECLRQKPIEQIMQRVPIDLLYLNPATSELSIKARWLKSLEQVLAEAGTATLVRDEQQAARSSSQFSLTQASSFDAASGQQQQQPGPAPLDLDGRQVRSLVAEIVRLQVVKEQQRLSGLRGAQEETKGANGDDLVGEHQQEEEEEQEENDEAREQEMISSRLDELFGAIYGQPRASMRPLFGPVVDGSIVPEDDVAVAMLKSGSNFAQRDLLIGTTQPSLNSGAIQAAYSSTNFLGQSRAETDEAATRGNHQESSGDQPTGKKLLEQWVSSNQELVPLMKLDHLIADRITAKMQARGFNSEQALEMVNLFVRSFYRYHNQEITNSIIDHYLSITSNERHSFRARRRLVARKMNDSSTRNSQAEINNNNKALKVNEQQLLLLDSVLELFQDAFTNVPLVKTALIHATKQLESLVDVFINQQFDRFKGSPKNFTETGSLNHFTDNLSNWPSDQTRLELLESFTSYAQSLFNHPAWPLQLHAPSNQTVYQPRSTYLFQFDPILLIHEMHRLLEDHLPAQATSARPGYGSSSETSAAIWRRTLKDASRALLMKLGRVEFRDKLSFGCALNYQDEKDSDDEDLAFRFSEWLCSGFTSILGNFVSNGRVDRPVTSVELESSTNLLQPSQDAASRASLNLSRVAQFDTKCQPLAGTQDHQHDHHSFQIDDTHSSLSDQPSNSAVHISCKREFNSILLDYLESSPSEIGTNRWGVFNIFTQQMATLGRPMPKARPWLISPLTEASSGQYDPKVSLMARSSFWSNFVPALNCSRTQPIIPASLLAIDSRQPNVPALNSSLFNLNLLFSCQQGSAKTPLEAVESLITYIGQQLRIMLSQWQANEVRHLTNLKGSHNLRMATNQSNEEATLDRQQRQDVEEQGRGGVAPISNSSQTLSTSGDHMKTSASNAKTGLINLHDANHVGLVFLGCALLISLTLASGVYVILRQCKNQAKFGKNANSKRRSQTLLSLDSDATTMPNGSVAIEQIDTTGTDMALNQISSPLNKNEAELEEKLDQKRELGVTVDKSMNILSGVEVETELCEGPKAIYLDQSNNQVNHVCTTDDYRNEPLIYEKHSNGTLTNVYNNNLSLRRNRHIIDNRPLLGSMQGQTEQMGYTTHIQEPIMMPILTTDPARQYQVQRNTGSFNGRKSRGCLVNSNNGHYGGSSSETPAQSSVASSSKKRVQISDPIGDSAARRIKKFNDDFEGPRQASSHHLVDAKLQPAEMNFCPVHRNLSHTSLTLESGYYFNDHDAFLAPADNIWNGTHIELLDQQQLGPTENNNCDHQLSVPEIITPFLQGSSMYEQHQYRQ